MQAYIHKRIYRLHCNKLKADEWMRSPLQSFIWVHFYNTERKRFLKATLMQVFPSGERDLCGWRRRLELRRPARVQESAAKDALLRGVGSEWCTLSHSGFTILRSEGQLSRRMKSQNQYRTKFKADIGQLYSIIIKNFFATCLSFWESRQHLNNCEGSIIACINGKKVVRGIVHNSTSSFMHSVRAFLFVPSCIPFLLSCSSFRPFQIWKFAYFW